MPNFRFLLLAGAVFAAPCAASAQTTQQLKITQLPALPSDAAPLTDLLPAASGACAGGNCKETVGQILGALASGTVSQSISSTTQFVIAPYRQTPQLVPASALISLLGAQQARNIQGLAPSATIDTTNAANIIAGTLSAGRLPFPSTATLGGVQAIAPAAHQWIASIGTNGVPTLAQPAVGDIAGLGTAATANTGTSGGTVPLLNVANTWGAAQTFGTINATAINLNGVALTTSGGGTGGTGGANVDLTGKSLTLSGAFNETSTASAAYTVDQTLALISANNSPTAATINQNAYGNSAVNADALRVVQTQLAGSNVVNTNSVAAYIDNQSATLGAAGNAVGLFAAGVAHVDNAYVWGINTVLTDAILGASGRGLFNEFDFNAKSASTTVNGLAINGTFAQQPTHANGFVITTTNINTRWNFAFLSANNAAVTGMYLGTAGQTTTANTNSQPLVFAFTDSNKALLTSQLVGTSNGIVATYPYIPPSYTFARLPPCVAGAQGALAVVTDASNPANGQPVSPGGSAHRLVMCDGTGFWNVE